MTKRLAVLGALLLVLGSVGVALAGAEAAGAAGKDVKLEGWVVCSCCGAKNANAEGAGCVKECNKGGSDLVFVSGGKTYKLADQTTAKAEVGRAVVAMGTLEGETLTVSKFAAAEKKS